MSENVDHLVRFAAGVRADGFTTVALLGMGGSSLGPEVLARTFAGEADQVSLVVLDTTDPASIRAVEESTPLDHVLFIAASKSGTTIETLTQLEYFWNKVPDGSHFVAITDPGTHLSDLGRERSFRRVFINPPDIGGRFSALSYFGLVPAALVGVEIARLLDGALSMRCALDGCVPVPQNPGALLGAAIGESALAGRDKLTIVVPDEISSFGTWVEQLIAESTGKNNTGILPVEGEEIGGPEVYGADRLFVTFGDHPGLAGLEDAGHPVIRIPFTDKYQLGQEFLRWEMATAVAGNVLGIHPFDQPNVQEAKDITSEILDGTSFSESTAPAVDVLGAVTGGDYIALLAYVPRNSENEVRLRRIRHALRDRFRVATTVGFGPRFLHSTGQFHKGGPNTGVFLQIVGDDPDDIEIPGRSFTFGELKHAQALGDLESLRSKGRRVARTTIDELEEIAR